MTKNIKSHSDASPRRHKRREEQLEFDLVSQPRVSRALPDLVARRAPAKSDSHAKRLRHGVLVQQFLK